MARIAGPSGSPTPEPLAWRRRLCLRPPAVAQNVPELVAELVGELAPIERADIDDDPSRSRRVAVQPNRRRPQGMVIDAQLVRLLVRNQLDPGQ
jgi:hypothetical protein